MISLNLASADFGHEVGMRMLFEFWDEAHALYATARATREAAVRSRLLKMADGYLRQAEVIRCANVIKAEFPKVENRVPGMAITNSGSLLPTGGR